ncbi:MAG: Gfo/Idh/MocA family oxidoreductase [Anaerolineae bacterium]|nr:Gfo/Idh/MocA family oxidoreductase [Anaerolineae bacterium]
MNIGILGSGFMGRTHARAYAKLPDIQVAAISSRTQINADKLGQEFGAWATTDALSIINDPTIDAISNTLPPHLHPQFTEAALLAGKHVLLEKPFGLTVADCDRMISAQHNSGKFLMIAHVLRFWPEYVALVDLVHSGKLGKPLAAAASRLLVMPDWSDWFADPALSGGAVLDLSVHDLDVLNWTFGQPVSVYARGQQARPGLWNHILALVDYGEAHGSVEGNEMMPRNYPFTMTYKVLCEGGSVEFVFRAGGVSIEMGGSSSLTVYEPGRIYKLEAESGDAYERQIAYFIDCVRTGRTPTIGSPEQGRLAVQLANATRASLESGKVITIQR